MKYNRYIVISLFVLLSCTIPAYSQLLQSKLRELVYSTVTLKEWQVADTALVQAFYNEQSEGLYWQKPAPLATKAFILPIIERSEELGLNKADYHYTELIALSRQQQPASTIDSIKADIIFSDAVLRFLWDLRYGRTPLLDYNGLKSAPDKQTVTQLLKQLVEAPDKNAFLNRLEGNDKQYVAMKSLLSHFITIKNAPEFREDSIVLKKVDVANKPLLIKLFQLGALDTNQRVTNTELLAALKRMQQQMDLLPDGKLNGPTLKALHVSIMERAAAIKTALNTLRWMRRFQKDSLAIVNIPSARLFVYGKSSLIYETRLVVGKKQTPTPTLSSYIQEVILYPYWNVPYSIATKELLPNIQRNLNYLDANNFQVLNKQGKVLDPVTINWKSLSANNFPYTIRQSTGCDNSLGLIKFNFYNPFSVYLHDTPSKGLFALKKRYFSHGCMRVEEPVVLAELLLDEEKATIRSLTEQCLRDQKPTIFMVKRPMPIAVLYNTAWYDSNGNILFYDNVYGK